MPQAAFKVGDRVFLTSTQPDTPDEPELVGKSLYDIELESGKTINGVYHGIEPAGDEGQ